jgi:hypothetical protein
VTTLSFDPSPRRAIRNPELELRSDGGRRPARAPRVVLAIEGTFDLEAALRAAAAACDRAADARVTVDLRRARIEDAALAAFVREVAGRTIAIVGLSRHHERLLRYLEEGTGAEGRAGG